MHSRKAIMTAYKEIAMRKAIGCQHKDCGDEEIVEKPLYTIDYFTLASVCAKDALAKRGSDGTRPLRGSRLPEPFGLHCTANIELVDRVKSER